MGDFIYNGLPVFYVSFMDFAHLLDCVKRNKRILSKNIINDRLREYYINTRKPIFGVSYNGVIIEINKNI